MQTSTESTDLPSILARLERLGASVAAVAADEGELIKNRAERMVAVRKEVAHREELDAARFEQAVSTLSAARTEALSAAVDWNDARAARVQDAYHASRQSVTERAQGVKDRRIGRIQGTIMRNRQARQEELERAKREHGDFLVSLVPLQKERREVRDSAYKSFRSYMPVIRPKMEGKGFADADSEKGATPDQTRYLLVAEIAKIRDDLAAADGLILTKIFRYVPLWLMLVLVPLGHYATISRHGFTNQSLFVIAALEAAVLLFWGVGLALAGKSIHRVASGLARAKHLEIAAGKQSLGGLSNLESEIENEEQAEGSSLSNTFHESDSEWRARVAEGHRKLESQLARIPARLERLYQKRISKIEADHEHALVRARTEADERVRLTASSREQTNGTIDRDVLAKIGKLVTPWESDVLVEASSLSAMEEISRSEFPAWDSRNTAAWSPVEIAPDSVRLGSIRVDAAKLANGLPHDGRLAFPNHGRLEVPFSLSFPHHGSLLIESDGGGDAAPVLNSVALRLFSSLPPGRASFVFIDPVGLGKDFSGLMHLADYEETLITHRIWTQSTHIEERLAELNEHIEKVIQMYLRNEYADIAEYNLHAGTIAEKYRFVLISGFPAGFSETACRRLLSIASSGARCGVYLLIQRDLRQPFPDAALEDELRRACIQVREDNCTFHLVNGPQGADVVAFDPPPVDEDAIMLVHRIGKASIDSNRVQVPFSHIAPEPDQIWSSSTTEELRVPVGRTGAKKLQMLAIGKGTRQHALVAGKTGSGKSTLFHVIITNLSLWCSPDEVEFYLVDFKKGVEFKCYAQKHLPHARVIAIESDREFALSVLQRIDAELKRRGELFRKAGAQDLAGYRRLSGQDPMPRSLLLIDEFQEFFTEDDSVAQEASLLLDRIVRQGRAFGIHVILGSQTLGGAYTLARATLGQMVIRVALQCNEADASLIMEDDNPAPRMLTRPGEGIYNDQAGALAANSPFQIVWLPEAERDEILDSVNAMAARRGNLPAAPIIFEGNAPADVRDNEEIKRLFAEIPASRPAKARAWLGAPNSIKGPTEAVFQRQSGSHMLIVGQSSERALSMLAINIVSLAAQYPADRAEFVILDPVAREDGGGFLERIAAALPHRVYIGGPGEVATLIGELSSELNARAATAGKDAPEVFLLVRDLQRFKSLRPDDEFRFSMDDETPAATPAQILANLLGEGGPVGMHVMAAIDTWNNVSRWIPRKVLAEFEMRVLFQMSANDSSNLIDSPAATQLGLHRALLYNEHLGTLETFRPYAMPDDGWVEELSDAEALSR